MSKAPESFERLRRLFSQFIEEYVPTFSELERLLTERAEEASAGREFASDLMAMLVRIRRLHQHVRELHPLEDEQPTPRPRTKDLLSTGEAATAVTVLAQMNLHLSEMERRLARFLPHRSSGSSKSRFFGRKRVTSSDGEQIRADSRRMSPAELRRKWCFDGQHGVDGGKGEYTLRQVAASIAQESGGHLRRRGLTGGLVGPSLVSSEQKRRTV
ncbi:hypothetical protein HY628_02105 [Candidatus Uhrbacteria bacterium]|nr:hypothetical protein [Candidatus Uhrbacteria bacterium]